jgi:hypothetical protein
MGANPIEALSLVKDFRAARGQRYPLWLVLLLVIMGTMSGCRGYRALEEFASRHHQALLERLSIPLNRYSSDSMFRRIMMNINLVRCHGYASVTSAMRLIVHDLDAMFKLLNSKVSQKASNYD